MIKAKTLKLLYKTGLPKFLRIQKKQNITVLNFHRISPDLDYFWNPIKPNSFKKLIEYLIKHYSIISFSDISEINFSSNNKKPFLILSFDDGYYDFYQYALPILVKYKLPCNHNIINVCVEKNQPIWTQRLNFIFNSCKDNNNYPVFKIDNKKFELNGKHWLSFYFSVFNNLMSLPMTERLEILRLKEEEFSISSNVKMMNWQEVIECSQNGVEIGCHTYNHDILYSIEDEKILWHEVVDSKKAIEEKIGKPVKVFALPNGKNNDCLDKIVEEAGFEFVLYVDDNLYEASEYDKEKVNRVPRINMIDESLEEMSLRAEMFHPKLRKYARIFS